MDEMKPPVGFGVRESEPPTDAGYLHLKKSILDQPVVVCITIFICFLFCFMFLLVSQYIFLI